MFTGIIQTLGKLRCLTPIGGDQRIHIETQAGFLEGVHIGDSLATQGVCLTVVELGATHFAADVSGETLQLTTLGKLAMGQNVNLEKALTLSTPLGGHLVSGHVDGVGVIESKQHDARSIRFRVKAPDDLARYIAAKGSITVDGISLTVNAVQGAVFELNLVPHSLHMTTASSWEAGMRLNLEVDVIARYLERLIGHSSVSKPDSITEAMLVRCGFSPV
jgi:riboflavin synthase